MSSAVEARLNIVVRILGVIFVVMGVTLGYFVSLAPLVPQIVPVFFLISVILIICGLFALIAKLA